MVLHQMYNVKDDIANALKSVCPLPLCASPSLCKNVLPGMLDMVTILFPVDIYACYVIY